MDEPSGVAEQFAAAMKTKGYQLDFTLESLQGEVDRVLIDRLEGELQARSDTAQREAQGLLAQAKTAADKGEPATINALRSQANAVDAKATSHEQWEELLSVAGQVEAAQHAAEEAVKLQKAKEDEALYESNLRISQSYLSTLGFRLDETGDLDVGTQLLLFPARPQRKESWPGSTARSVCAI